MAVTETVSSSRAAERGRLARATVPALLMLLGTLLLQAAWILSVPAFRGVDEFDHAYRAAAVARGEWAPGTRPAPDGRGGLVTVPRDVVTAAGPECRSRAYTGHDNCAPVGDATGDPVRVASAASRYQPFFYWVVGEPARAFHGTAALYAMRVTGGLVCALFVAVAGWAVSLWARTLWPLVALLGSLTPVAVYSSATAAPNGVEILAALSVWFTLTGLAVDDLPESVERALLWASLPGAMMLATVRSLGVGWLVLCLVVVGAVVGPSATRRIVRRNRGTLGWWALLVGATVAGAVAWLTTARPNGLEESANNPGALVGSLIQVPVWVLQSVATGVGRADPAPGVVYALCGALLLALVGVAMRQAAPALRRLMLGIAVASVAGPFALTLLTYRDVGVVWQGRYGLPFSLGLMALTALALDRRRLGSARMLPWLLVGVALFAIGHAADVLYVLAGQRHESPSVGLGLWHVPSPWLVGALTLLGWSVLATALPAWQRRARSRGSGSPRRARRRAARGTAPRR